MISKDDFTVWKIVLYISIIVGVFSLVTLIINIISECSCKDKECGSAGPDCDKSCGTCPDGKTCAQGKCVEPPAARVCTSDSSCPDGSTCQNGICTDNSDTVDCEGKDCGPGCGECGPGHECSPYGVCVCIPNCGENNERECGSDGCDIEGCGKCDYGQKCDDGKCVSL